MSINSIQKEIDIFWFRRDLRLEDNQGLFNALKQSQCVLPVFIFDTTILDELEDRSDRRVVFIHEYLQKIKKSINEAGSDLYVGIGTPIDIFKEIGTSFKIKSIHTNEDYEPYAIKRDSNIETWAKENSIRFNRYKDHVIFHPNEILNESGGFYKIYTPFKNKWKIKYSNLISTEIVESENWTHHFIKDVKFDFPSLDSLGFVPDLFDKNLISINTKAITTYQSTRDIPALESGTSNIGIHLRFGTVSIRKVVNYAVATNDTWWNELIWREFFIHMLYHAPYLENQPFQKKFDRLTWRFSEEEFEKWKLGMTGFPLVDAGMRQLKETGWMHNRVRMVVANFFTKEMFFDWRLGERYFASLLLDFELASNVGNWQWCAGCGCDAQPYFRIFNAELQQQKFDPELAYIRRWIPEYGTKDYPMPMFNRKSVIERYKSQTAVFKEN